ncbi:hypothetical protein SteCoe_21962 [Stentor coeruleus]|uniref:Acyl carrier protein n=1 Tax=Stentor coeruleus TaxID=5963 RepID=A0A1R2BNE6_9CILI|nr:hypothetical protein SteCoe_21962 [Stentor coeruleus]
MWRFLIRKFSTSEMEFKVTEILKRFNTVDSSKITPTATFKEIGLDSLDSVEAIVAMEEILGVELSDEDAFKINTIQEAIKIFSKNSKN